MGLDSILLKRPIRASQFRCGRLHCFPFLSPRDVCRLLVFRDRMHITSYAGYWFRFSEFDCPISSASFNLRRVH